MVDSAAALIGDGLGTMGVHGRRQAPGALPDIARVSGPNELLMMQAMMVRDLPRSTIDQGTETGVAGVLEKYRDEPEHIEVFERHFQTLGAEDALSVTGIDTDGQAIHLFTLKEKRTKVGAGERMRWKMLTAHLAAGLRLRNALESSARESNLTPSRPKSRTLRCGSRSRVRRSLGSARAPDTHTTRRVRPRDPR